MKNSSATLSLLALALLALPASLPGQIRDDRRARIVTRNELASPHDVSDVTFSPTSPNQLDFGEDVTARFEYRTSHPGGVRIFPRPLTNGSPTPNYAASGSPVYAAGRGRGSGTFTVRSGNTVVNQVRIRMYAADDPDRLLHESTIEVRFGFGMPGLPETTLPQFEIYQPDLEEFRPADEAIREAVTEAEEVEEVEEAVEAVEAEEAAGPSGSGQTAPCDSAEVEILADGTVKTTYSDGSTYAIHPSGEWTRCIPNPETEEMMCSRALFIQVPQIIPAEDLASVDAEWLSELNNWVEYVGDALLNRMYTLTGDSAAVQRYLEFESSADRSLYERVDLRLNTTNRLIEVMQ